MIAALLSALVSFAKFTKVVERCVEHVILFVAVTLYPVYGGHLMPVSLSRREFTVAYGPGLTTVRPWAMEECGC